MTLFTGLSAFPLTPFRDDQVDEGAFVGLIRRLATSGVDSITVLGSTGSYAYLNADERARLLSWRLSTRILRRFMLGSEHYEPRKSCRISKMPNVPAHPVYCWLQ